MRVHELAPGTPTPSPRAVHGFGNALAWSYVMTGGRMATTLGVSLVLARLLGPAAFGLIAMANVYVLFIEMIVRQGLVAAIIQRPNLGRAHMDTAFWMITAVIVGLIPLSIGLSPAWARLNQTPQLQPIIVGLTPVLALKGLAVVQEAHLRRRLDYRSLALRTNLAVFLGGAVGIVLAYLGAGVWALVGQQLTLAAVEVVVLWRVSDWRPRMSFDRMAARELIGFSSLSGLAGLGVFLNKRMDALMIGLFFGPIPAGLFRLAGRLADTVMETAGGALQSVSLPELSRFSGDPEVFNRRTGEILHLAAVLTVPLFAVLAVVSGPLLALLGPDWAAATTALRVLCVLGVIQVFTNLVGPILQAAGRPGVLAGFAWVAAGLSAAAFAGGGLVLDGLALDVQVGGLALSRLVGYVLMLVLLAGILPRVLGVRWGTVAAAMARPVAASLLGHVAATAVLGRLGLVDGMGHAPHLLVSVVIAGLLVGSAVLVADPVARTVGRRLWTSLRGASRTHRGRSEVDAVETAP